MTKNATNFQKFSKLALIVKKIADENPDLKAQIIAESESTSNNSWNKIQSWTSKQLFQDLKEKNISEFTTTKVKKTLLKKKVGKKPKNCFNIFKIPKADISRIDAFDIENVLKSLPENLQIQLSLTSGGSRFTNTGITKIKDLSFLGDGELIKSIRDMYPDINDIVFRGMRKIGAKTNSKSNCAYYIKVMFADDILTPEEKSREVIIGVNLKDLSPNQQKERLRRKNEAEEEKRLRRKTLKKIKTPKKVVYKSDDKEIKKKIEDEKLKKDLTTKRIKEFNLAIKNLRELLDEGIITKKQFRNSFDKLNNNLRKGGVI